MVDRGENTDESEPQRDLQGPRRKTGEDARRSDSEEEHAHHAEAAPAVGEPSGRDRAGAERDEAAERKGQELRVAAAELLAHGEDHRGENEHEQVIERVPEIEVEAHAARGAHGKIHLEVCRLHAEV